MLIQYLFLNHVYEVSGNGALQEIQSDWRHAMVTQQLGGGVHVWFMNGWCSALFYNFVVLFNRELNGDYFGIVTMLIEYVLR